ncbi:MAG: 3-keto-5-aminohexanoate cleavage protein [Desulfarculus sp.]|nr:3-keto-5-aminohexanoate cleavage protein [Pseudomonadota bacterium]MBV1718324.1 3-keto-5-aminohexanoate cleavage protein [Desulfarculus sp.]MBU4573509.1 3-keto-5-aminohexanoate cleavage protein [Pseudomonadota bacterium]MBU4599515.1 3-keto-5-aminohexanoate cleavage protein [Pseudomonadota bacterium]MBV1739659.1 3-keto-5-aminohexanoate cleavage protein [Desulfarculus sp.]
MESLAKNKVVITVAQTGAMSSKSMNPNVPEQPVEIADSAYECYNEGAAICHIHARGKDGLPTADTDIYQDIHDRIRAKCNMIIQDSTGGGPNLSQEERIQCLKTGPEMASLNMGSLMRIGGPYKGTAWSNLPEEIDHYVKEMAKYNVMPEMEVFNHGMLVDVRRVIKEGLVKKPYYVNIVLGMRYQGAEPATPDTLYSIVKSLPPDTIFNCTGVGSMQTPMATMAMLLGGCVRVGLEDNLYYTKGELAKSNAQLVARIVRIARDLGKEPATPDEARAYFGLTPVAG